MKTFEAIYCLLFIGYFICKKTIINSANANYFAIGFVIVLILVAVTQFMLKKRKSN